MLDVKLSHLQNLGQTGSLISESHMQSAKNYLATTITRLCSDPAEQVELADSLSMAFLVMLERLSPIERAVFLLREVFEYDYPEIAQIVGKSAENCRQILKRSRQPITTRHPRFPVSHQQQEQITVQFMDAWTQGKWLDFCLPFSANGCPPIALT